MEAQGGLIQISNKSKILNPGIDNQIGLFIDEQTGLLSGKLKNGQHVDLTVLSPEAEGKTTDNTPTELRINNDIVVIPPRIKVSINNTLFYSYFVVATRTGGSAPGTVGASGIIQLQFMVRNLNGVTSIVVTNSPANLNTGDAEASAWIAAITLGGDNNDEIILTVTGEANKNISWNARIVLLGNLDFNS